MGREEHTIQDTEANTGHSGCAFILVEISHAPARFNTRSHTCFRRNHTEALPNTVTQHNFLRKGTAIRSGLYSVDVSPLPIVECVTKMCHY